MQQMLSAARIGHSKNYIFILSDYINIIENEKYHKLQSSHKQKKVYF